MPVNETENVLAELTATRQAATIPESEIKPLTENPPNPVNPQKPDINNLIDGHGKHFDAAVHITDAVGNPVLTKGGYLKRKSGRPRNTEIPRPPLNLIKPNPQSEGGNNSGAATDVTDVIPEAAPPVAESANWNLKLRMIGDRLMRLYCGFGKMVFGAGWEPTKEEIDELTRLCAEWLKTKNITQFTPGKELLLGMAAFAAIRVAKDEPTQKKLAAWFGGIFKRIINFVQVRILRIAAWWKSR